MTLILFFLAACGQKEEVASEAAASVMQPAEQIPVVVDEGPVKMIDDPVKAPEKTLVEDLPEKKMPLPSRTETVSEDTTDDEVMEVTEGDAGDIPETVSEDSAPVTDGSLNGISVYVDPGHGGDAACSTEYDGKTYERPSSGGGMGSFPNNSLGTTAGTSGGGWSECDAVYQMALIIRDELKKAGCNVTMSRDDIHTAADGGGTAIGNWERGRRAAAYDYWIVIHADGGGGNGIHCVSWQSDPLFRTFLCDTFLNAMADYGRPLYTASGYSTGYSGNSSGTLQAPSEYVRNGGDPSRMLYIEAGFMDNEADMAYMVSDKGRQELAAAAVSAILSQETGEGQ